MIPVTMGVDKKWVHQNKNLPSIKKVTKQNSINIVYLGTLSFVRNPLFIINAFNKVQKEYPICRLFLIGSTVNKLEEKIEFDERIREFLKRIRRIAIVSSTDSLIQYS